jgi:hypothetical protein
MPDERFDIPEQLIYFALRTTHHSFPVSTQNLLAHSITQKQFDFFCTIQKKELTCAPDLMIEDNLICADLTGFMGTRPSGVRGTIGF